MEPYTFNLDTYSMELDYIFFFEILRANAAQLIQDIQTLGGRVVWQREGFLEVYLLVVFDKGVDQDTTITELQKKGNLFQVEIFY